MRGLARAVKLAIVNLVYSAMFLMEISDALCVALRILDLSVLKSAGGKVRCDLIFGLRIFELNLLFPFMTYRNNP